MHNAVSIDGARSRGTLTVERTFHATIGGTMHPDAALKRDESAFTALDLLQRAAQHKGMRLQGGTSQRIISEPLRTYDLDDVTLAALAAVGIRRQPRPDCRDLFTLIDENPQVEVPGWAPSCYWNFKRDGGDGAFDLRISLEVELAISAEQRGVVLTPRALGTFVSPCDHLPNERMFHALVERDPDAPPVARELAANDGHIVVHWSDLGLGGIRSLHELFQEFAGRAPAVLCLGSSAEIFDPVAHPRWQVPLDALYVIEAAQPRVIQTWREQLGAYRARLVA